MTQSFDIDDLKKRMQGALSVLRAELSGLRTGRASSAMLEPLQIEAYGATTPLPQVATISVPEPRMLSVQVWDRSLLSAVERAIRESNLGLNPVVDGQLLRLPIPELNQERRQELIRIAHKYAEQARVAIRHVRRDGMDAVKKLEKDGELGQDESRTQADDVQKLTDSMIAEVDAILAKKEQEIAQV